MILTRRRLTLKKLNFAVAIVICFFLSACGGGEQGGNGGPITYPTRPLPSKFLAVTVSTENVYDIVPLAITVAKKAKARGLQAVIITFDWEGTIQADGIVDPNTAYAYNEIKLAIWEIKNQGLLCILRINVNTGGAWRAWPSWVSPTETYFVQVPNVFPPYGVDEIFPWDTAYQTRWNNVLVNMANMFKTDRTNPIASPDGIQITVGGSFGGQKLVGYDSSGWTHSNYDQLFDAQKWHVDRHMATLGTVVNHNILMVDSLYPTDPDYEDTVGDYARGKNVNWIQSNIGACTLKGTADGANTSKMLARFNSGGAKIILEDVNAASKCSGLGLSASLANRVSYLQEAATGYGFEISAIVINAADLDDTDGIAAAKAALGI